MRCHRNRLKQPLLWQRYQYEICVTLVIIAAFNDWFESVVSYHQYSGAVSADSVQTPLQAGSTAVDAAAQLVREGGWSCLCECPGTPIDQCQLT